jgi:hypothetical protein
VDRLTLHGRVRSTRADDPDSEPVATVLSVTFGDGAPSPQRLGRVGDNRTLHQLSADGRFSLELPLTDVSVITIARPGHLPRMVEVQPLRSGFRLARDPVRVRCDIDVELTPRLDAHGAPNRPLRERITMPTKNRPLIAEWDHVLRADPGDDFVPLFARTL